MARDFHREMAYQIVEAAFSKLPAKDKGALMRIIVGVTRKFVVGLTSDIRDFHQKFGLEYDGPPRPLDQEMSDFRVKFMQEELDEYRTAVYAGDLPKQFDALIDLIYVALGTSYLQGFPFAKGWAEVQAANMRKVRADEAGQSKRSSTLDVVKPVGWVGPDIDSIIEREIAIFEARKTGWKG